MAKIDVVDQKVTDIKESLEDVRDELRSISNQILKNTASISQQKIINYVLSAIGTVALTVTLTTLFSNVI